LNNHNGQLTGIDVSGGTEILKVHTGENISGLTDSDNYFLKLINGNGQVEYRKVTTLDGVTHIGDSIQYDFDDGSTLMIRDSVVDLAGVRDSIQNNIDSIAARRTAINEIGDALDVHRTDINQNITNIVELNDSIDQHRIDIDAISEVDTVIHLGDS